MCTYDIGIIGAGPCGISCAIKAAQKGNKVVIVECGNDFENRYCAVDGGKECNSCQFCNVISGFGGCVHYGDSAKLTYYPSGKALYKKLNNDYERIRNEACQLWDIKLESDFISNTIEAEGYDFTVKEYPVCVVDSEHIKKQIRRWRREIQDYKVEYIQKEMIDFKKEDNVFRVILSDQEVFSCKKLIIAIGRKGLSWLRDNVQKKGIQFKTPVPSIGFRFEMPKEYLVDLGKLHPDFKARTKRNNIKFKTFCFCGGANGGRLKFLNYGKYTLLDGHILAESDKESKYGNFALLRQVAPLGEAKIDYHQLIDNILLNYEEVSNGRPIYQSYYNFSRGENSGSDINISVPCIKSGRVCGLLPFDLDEYCKVAQEILSYIAHRQNIKEDLLFMQVNVIGLEIEGMWDTIITDENFMTSIKNLYIGGDCGGETQGILQATMMGIKIAEVV